MSSRELETAAKYQFHRDPSQVTNYPVRKLPCVVMPDFVFYPSCDCLID